MGVVHRIGAADTCEGDVEGKDRICDAVHQLRIAFDLMLKYDHATSYPIRETVL